MKISTIAKLVLYPDSDQMLIAIIKGLEENEIPYIVVGKMSNLLFRTVTYDGVLIITSKIRGKNMAENSFTLSCGETLANALTELASRDRGGFEGLYGIPGTIGGMIMQNAGAFGYEIKDRFLGADCYMLDGGRIRHLTHEEMCFSYRSSALKKKRAILLNATFDFVYKNRECILDEIKEYRERRLASQPIEYPSLGSVFKRYDGVGAGYYIDKSGLKGCSFGGARVSEKHAGFIVNTGGATADDYLKLIDTVKRRVYSTFGIELEEEIEIIQ